MTNVDVLSTVAAAEKALPTMTIEQALAVAAWCKATVIECSTNRIHAARRIADLRRALRSAGLKQDLPR
ncbi:hypothetical protein BH18ACI5_BH18ACI5_04500 [soil metagenome]